jgi:hypothetical protein
MQGREKRKEGEKGSGLKDCKIARPVSQSKFSLFSDAKAPDFMPGGFCQLIANFQTLSCRFSAHPRPEKIIAFFNSGRKSGYCEILHNRLF